MSGVCNKVCVNSVGVRNLDKGARLKDKIGSKKLI